MKFKDDPNELLEMLRAFVGSLYGRYFNSGALYQKPDARWSQQPNDAVVWFDLFSDKQDPRAGVIYKAPAVVGWHEVRGLEDGELVDMVRNRLYSTYDGALIDFGGLVAERVQRHGPSLPSVTEA